jgi:hypothetical protein
VHVHEFVRADMISGFWLEWQKHGACSQADGRTKILETFVGENEWVAMCGDDDLKCMSELDRLCTTFLLRCSDPRTFRGSPHPGWLE